jgi:CDP-2,3-bis-(O-geranylgeranyl)-sn-glycerol synthase
LGYRFRWPVDGGIRFFDRRPLLGPSKTIRGISAAILATALASIVVGLPLRIGVLVAVWAMVGDVLSSFIKRRLGMPPSHAAPGLDQGLESLFPLLAVRSHLGLSFPEVMATVATFIVAHAVWSYQKDGIAKLSKSKKVEIAKEIWRSALWAPLAVFVAHVIVSLAFNGYQRMPALDIPMHLLGGMAIAFFFSRLLDILGDHAIVGRVDGLLWAIFLIALTATSAVLWEFAEYVSDHSFGTQAQGGLEDTLLDMLLGIVGGFTMVPLLLWARHGYRETRHK